MRTPIAIICLLAACSADRDVGGSQSDTPEIRIAPEYEMREVFDLVIHGLIGEDITVLPLRDPDDVRAAQALLARRRGIAEGGRTAITDILERNPGDRTVHATAELYFRAFEIELQQNAAQLEAVSLLLDPHKVDWDLGGRYRTQEAEREHEALQRRVRELEHEKLGAMQAVVAVDQPAAPGR